MSLNPTNCGYGGTTTLTYDSGDVPVYIYITGDGAASDDEYTNILVAEVFLSAPTFKQINPKGPWGLSMTGTTEIYLQKVLQGRYQNLPPGNYTLNIAKVVADEWIMLNTINFSIGPVPFALNPQNMNLTYSPDPNYVYTPPNSVYVQLYPKTTTNPPPTPAWTCTYSNVDPIIDPSPLWTNNPPIINFTNTTSKFIYLEQSVLNSGATPGSTNPDDYALQYLVAGTYTLRITDYLQIYYEADLVIASPTITLGTPTNGTMALTVSNFPQNGFVSIHASPTPTDFTNTVIDWGRRSKMTRVWNYMMFSPQIVLTLELVNYKPNPPTGGADYPYPYAPGQYYLRLTDYRSLTLFQPFVVPEPQIVSTIPSSYAYTANTTLQTAGVRNGTTITLIPTLTTPYSFVFGSVTNGTTTNPFPSLSENALPLTVFRNILFTFYCEFTSFDQVIHSDSTTSFTISPPTPQITGVSSNYANDATITYSGSTGDVYLVIYNTNTYYKNFGTTSVVLNVNDNYINLNTGSGSALSDIYPGSTCYLACEGKVSATFTITSTPPSQSITSRSSSYAYGASIILDSTGMDTTKPVSLYSQEIATGNISSAPLNNFDGSGTSTTPMPTSMDNAVNLPITLYTLFPTSIYFVAVSDQVYTESFVIQPPTAVTGFASSYPIDSVITFTGFTSTTNYLVVHTANDIYYCQAGANSITLSSTQLLQTLYDSTNTLQLNAVDANSQFYIAGEDQVSTPFSITNGTSKIAYNRTNTNWSVLPVPDGHYNASIDGVSYLSTGNNSYTFNINGSDVGYWANPSITVTNGSINLTLKNALPSYILTFTGSTTASIPFNVLSDYGTIKTDAVTLLKQINYYEGVYRIADTNTYVLYDAQGNPYNYTPPQNQLPPNNLDLNTATPQQLYEGVTYTNYLPCLFISSVVGYPFVLVPNTQPPLNTGMLYCPYKNQDYTADNVRYLWRLSNYVRANQTDTTIRTIVNNVCKALTYASNPSNVAGKYNQGINFNIYTLKDNDGVSVSTKNDFSADVITPLLSGIHSILQFYTLYPQMSQYMNITNSVTSGGLVPNSFDYIGSYTGNRDQQNVYPLMDSVVSGGQQFGLTMVGFSCTAEILLNDDFNIMKYYDDLTVTDYTSMFPTRSAFTSANIQKIIDIYYTLGYTGHNFGGQVTQLIDTTPGSDQNTIHSNAYIVNVLIDDINSGSSTPTFPIWCIPDSGWAGGGTAEIFSYQLLVAALCKDYTRFCNFHRMYYYFLFLQNGGQMDQSKPLWEGMIPKTGYDGLIAIYNINGVPYLDQDGNQVYLKAEKTGTAKPVRYGTGYNPNDADNGNWQPSYYNVAGTATKCQSFDGVYNGIFVYDVSGNLIQGGWSNTQPGGTNAPGYLRNRYTVAFSRPSYLMGFCFDVTPIQIVQPPTVANGLNSTTQAEILANGPYYTVKNPSYVWNGSSLRSATDADLNVFIAYYIADQLYQNGVWVDNSDTNPAITDNSLAYYATGKGVTWSNMKKNIAKSFNENTGGASYGAYQNTSGNVLAINIGENPATQTPFNIVGMGHDSDVNADFNIHLDYTDLRAYQLLDIEQNTV